MEYYHYSPFETFVVLIADQFVERDDGPLEQQRPEKPPLSKKSSQQRG